MLITAIKTLVTVLHHNKNTFFSCVSAFSNFLHNFSTGEAKLKYDSSKYKLGFPLSNGKKFGFIAFLV